MKQYDMLKDSPGKSLIFFAMPIILGNLFQQFYNMTDSIIVGRFVGENALAAVGASYSLTTVFIMIAIGSGMGASVLISQYMGAKEYYKMKTSVYTALISFLLVSIIMLIFGLLMKERLLIKLNTPSNILSDSVLYLEIYFIGLPFLFMYNVLSAVFNALGKSQIPLYLLIFSSVLNVFLDLYFVIEFEMGVAGVAIATVIAQGISAAASFAILIRTLKNFNDLNEKEVKLYNFSMLEKMVYIAIPSVLQQSIVSIGMLLVQSVVNRYGSSVLAGYSAGMRVESICIVPMIAAGNAISTFTAQNLGAGQIDRVRKGYKVGYKIIIAFAIIICIIISLLHSSIISAFVDPESGKEAFMVGSSYLKFIGFFFAFIGFKAVTDGVLRGSGDMVVFTLANLVNLGIRVFVAFQFAPAWGVQAVWYAVPMGWTANWLISFSRYLTGAWSKKNIIN